MLSTNKCLSASTKMSQTKTEIKIHKVKYR